jgi:hypothetical protein
VFSREVRARTATDPRVVERRRAAQSRAGDGAREAFEQIWEEVLLDKQGEIAAEFDAIHSVERARDVGSLETLIQPEAMRPYLIEELRRDRD